MTVDLHVHSTVSDGTLSATEIIEKANELGLTAVALTDHDSILGITEALEASHKAKTKFIPGLELSSKHNGFEVHLLGYFVDHKSPELTSKLKELRDSRKQRAEVIVTRLQDLGAPILFEDVLKLSDDGAIGRPHIAQALVACGFVRDISEAFELFLKSGSPAFVDKYVMSVPEIIELVHSVGGIVSVAHPGASKLTDDDISTFHELGIDAIEVWHIDQTEEQSQHYSSLAERLGLLKTGGSDCHGSRKKHGFVMGSVHVPDSIIEPLRLRARQTSRG